MSKRILVVEDQPDNRQIIRDMLAPTDYEITEAEDGQQALEAIAKQCVSISGSTIVLSLSGESQTRLSLHPQPICRHTQIPLRCSISSY
jgi:CheY-like chemotaxis protein